MTLSRARRRPPGCPPALALDELAAGDLDRDPQGDELREHLRECAACRALMAARAADPLLVPDGAALAALRQAAPAPVASGGGVRPRRRSGSRWPLSVGLVAGGLAALALALVVRPGGDGSGGERAKGGLALTVHVRRASGAIESVNGEGTLRAGEQMRFTLHSAVAGHAVVLGLDQSPAVFIYAPAIEVASGQPTTVAGSVVADATPGVERVVAVVCPTAPVTETLRRQATAALARAGNRPQAVSSLGTGCAEAAVVLRKEP